MEAKLMILPFPSGIILLAANWQRRNVAVRFTSKTFLPIVQREILAGMPALYSGTIDQNIKLPSQQIHGLIEGPF